jgi:hypothetical protein
MKLSLPLLLFASVATPSVFCHESKDDEPKVRRRAVNGTTPADGMLNGRNQTQENDYQALIVGGTQARHLREFPYYGKWTQKDHAKQGKIGSSSAQHIIFSSPLSNAFKKVEWIGLCGGSLIAPDIVLSAAHCNVNWAPNSMLVGAYRSDTASSGGVYRTIVEKTQHPNFGSNTFANDFLLIRLDRPVTTVGNVKLRINKNRNQPATSKALTVIGLGAITEGGNGPNDKILRKVEVRVISTKRCKAQYGSRQIKSSMFCACKEAVLTTTCFMKQKVCFVPIVIRL